MKERNRIRVFIDGKPYNMGGYESEEYLQSLANYINIKIEELKHEVGFSRLDRDIESVLIQINIADDLFKLRKSKEEILEQYKEKQKENLELKRENIGFETKLESLEKENQEIQKKNTEFAIKLEVMEQEKQHCPE